MTIYLSSHRLWAITGILAALDVLALGLGRELHFLLAAISSFGLVWQPTLLAVYLAGIRTHRLVGWAWGAVAWLLVWLLKFAVLDGDGAGLGFVMLLSLATTLAGVLSLRLRGFDIAFAQPGDRLAADRSWQFGLLDMMLMMTVIAVAAAALRAFSIEPLQATWDSLAQMQLGTTILVAAISLGIVVGCMPWIWVAITWYDNDERLLLTWSLIFVFSMVCFGCYGLMAILGAIAMTCLQLPVLLCLWRYNYTWQGEYQRWRQSYWDR